MKSFYFRFTKSRLVVIQLRLWRGIKCLNNWITYVSPWILLDMIMEKGVSIYKPKMKINETNGCDSATRNYWTPSSKHLSWRRLSLISKSTKRKSLIYGKIKYLINSISIGIMSITKHFIWINFRNIKVLKRS